MFQLLNVVMRFKQNISCIITETCTSYQEVPAVYSLELLYFTVLANISRVLSTFSVWKKCSMVNCLAGRCPCCNGQAWLLKWKSADVGSRAVVWYMIPTNYALYGESRTALCYSVTVQCVCSPVILCHIWYVMPVCLPVCLSVFLSVTKSCPQLTPVFK